MVPVLGFKVKNSHILICDTLVVLKFKILLHVSNGYWAWMAYNLYIKDHWLNQMALTITLKLPF